MKLILTVFLLIPVTIFAADTIPEQFLGRWEAYGTGTRAVYGDLQVTKDSLSFKLLGSHTFVVLGASDESVVLEMSESYLDNDRHYLRLDQIIRSKGKQTWRDVSLDR